MCLFANSTIAWKQWILSVHVSKGSNTRRKIFVKVHSFLMGKERRRKTNERFRLVTMNSLYEMAMSVFLVMENCSHRSPTSVTLVRQRLSAKNSYISTTTIWWTDQWIFRNSWSKTHPRWQKWQCPQNPDGLLSLSNAEGWKSTLKRR